jgi:hypothetical protein
VIKLNKTAYSTVIISMIKIVAVADVGDMELNFAGQFTLVQRFKRGVRDNAIMLRRNSHFGRECRNPEAKDANCSNTSLCSGYRRTLATISLPV